MFDIIGSFVVRLLPASSVGQLRATLAGFDRVELNATHITDKASLHEALYHAMNFAAFTSSPGLNNWDALSDLLWQWILGEAGHEVTKLAFVVEHASSLLARDTELVFQFAEICVQLESAVNEARREANDSPLLVRVFLVG